MTSKKTSMLTLVAVFLLAAVLYFWTLDDLNGSAGAPEAIESGRGEFARVLGDGTDTSIGDLRGIGAATQPQPITMAPEMAYAEAMSILACERAVRDVELDPSMTQEQVAQFESSRVESLDCSSLDSPYTAQELAKYSAEKGNIQAQIDYSAIAAPMFEEEANALDPELIVQFKSDSLRFLNIAAASGNPDALARLSANYRQGLFSERDMAKAYAYSYAQNQVAPSRLTQKLLDQYAVELSEDELLRAQQLGRSLTHRK